MKKLQQKITNLSATRTDSGFTSYVTGIQGRYIVGLTNNTTKAKTRNEAQSNLKSKLINQIKKLSKSFGTITIGGRTDTDTGTKYLDIGTAINNLDEAIKIAIKYNQLAIRDTRDNKEIRTQ